MKTKAIFYINIIAFAFLSGYMSSCTEKCYDHFIFFYHHGFLMKKDNDILGIWNRGNECTWKVNQIIKNKLLSSKAIYLLKWKSGYYNYFTKDDLVFFPEVRKYGLPKDYHMPSFDIKRITMYSKILVLIVD